MNALTPNTQNLPIDYVGLWHKSRLSVHDVIEKEPEVLKVGDVTICTLGNFSASIGKAKSKKPSLTTSIKRTTQRQVV